MGAYYPDFTVISFSCILFSRDHVCRYQLTIDNLKNRMDETSCLLLLHTATVGGYCRVPNECICRSGYSGATCQTGKCHNLKIFHMRICLAACMCRIDYSHKTMVMHFLFPRFDAL